MDSLLRPLEALIVAMARPRLRWPPTFVVGAPRSGTTLVGLHLTNCLRFAGFPNVAKSHPRIPFLSTRRAFESGDLTQTYDNRYGHVEGPLAPSDGWDVLERFFPSYAEAGPAEVRHPRRLVSLVGLFEELYGAPFLVKNNANSMRVRALAALFPEALFIQVRRDLPSAAASLLEARTRHGVPLGKWWSAAPPRFLGRASWKDQLEQVVATLWDLESYVGTHLEQLAPGRWLSVDYDEFCGAPQVLIDQLQAWYSERGVELEVLPGERPTSFRARGLGASRRSELEAAIAPIVESLRDELRTGEPAS